jgi:hypothetical protein
MNYSETKYVPGYGYVTTYTGGGVWQDMGKKAAVNIGKKVVGAIGEKIGQKIADKIVNKPKTSRKVIKELNDYAKTREDVLKEIKIIPYNNKGKGLSKEIRQALYGSSNVKPSKTKYLI